MQAGLKKVDGATAVTSTKTKKVVQVPQTLGLVETCPCITRANPILFPSLKRLVPHSVAYSNGILHTAKRAEVEQNFYEAGKHKVIC